MKEKCASIREQQIYYINKMQIYTYFLSLKCRVPLTILNRVLFNNAISENGSHDKCCLLFYNKIYFEEMHIFKFPVLSSIYTTFTKH